MKAWMTSAGLTQDKKASFWRYGISLVQRRRRKKTSASNLLWKSLGCHQLLDPFLLFNMVTQVYILPWQTGWELWLLFWDCCYWELSCGRPSEERGTVVTGTFTRALCIFWDAVRINVIKINVAVSDNTENESDPRRRTQRALADV